MLRSEQPRQRADVEIFAKETPKDQRTQENFGDFTGQEHAPESLGFEDYAKGVIAQGSGCCAQGSTPRHSHWSMHESMLFPRQQLVKFDFDETVVP